MNTEEIIEKETPEFIDLTIANKVENKEYEEFVNDDNIDAFKLLSLKSKVNDINSIMENLNEKQAELISEDADFDFIDERLETLTEEEINNMNGEQLDAVLTDENGTLLEFTVDFGNDTKALYQFKKEFLIMRKQSLDAFKKFDEELTKINAEIAESQEEFDKLVNEFGNVSNLIRSTLIKRLENADTEEQKELFEKMLVSFDNGLALENIKSYCKSYKGRNILWDHKDDKQATYIYRRYLKVIKNLNIKTDLTKFNFLEKRFLTEEYQERDNIFVFAIIHYISSWHNKSYTKADGLFLTQFTINLKNLFYNKFDSEADKETFINNIHDVIKIIG